MNRLVTILFLFLAIVLLLGGCTYNYPYGYDPHSYPENYGFVAPCYYYSPYGYYSYSPYPFSGPYGNYYYPSPRYYLGESPGEFTERHFKPGEQPDGEK